MSTAEIKLDIINKISKLKEIRIIEEIRKLIDFELDTSVFQLNESQKIRLFEAKNDKFLTEKDANKEIEEWLQEK
ncbi:MAG: hypothetical protein LBE36_03960 [Flavobacteriaceae bacterium]|jgi:hypothetical protein|nr:hypothetical protein [Flavobacteriaceae bacterium]